MIDCKKENIILNSVGKFFGFAFIGLLLNAILRLDFLVLGTGIGEISLTEFTQVALLLSTACLFYRTAKNKKELKRASVLIGSFFLVMLIRELDVYFDMIVHGFWLYPALAVTISALFYAKKELKETINGLNIILKEKSMNILILGLAFLMVYSRLYGMGDFWKDVMAEDYVRVVKNISEESTELLFYTIIYIGAFKTNSHLNKK